MMFRQLFSKLPQLQPYRCNLKMTKLTDIYNKQMAAENNTQVTQGKAWKAEQLRLKSTDDLHKLWYVLVQEKNALYSDNALKRKIQQPIGPQGRMSKVKISMARLLTIINERKTIGIKYRQYLEDQYVMKQKESFDKQYLEQMKQQKTPEITENLLLSKYKALKSGQDNTKYIKSALQIQQEKENLKQLLNEKYNYKDKKIVDQDYEVKEDEQVIRKFKSSFERQIEEGQMKISQDEVLRQHVRNWKMLNFKQRRVVLGFLNARRARDAKSQFLKELDLLGQKIAFDNLNQRI